MEKKMILIVDDEPSMILGQRFILEDEGYEIIGAMDAVDGFEKAKYHKPDLIILDIMMPPKYEYEGIIACKKLKNDRETCKIPIIILTVKGREKDVLLSKESGADVFMNKPFDSNELLKTIETLIEAPSK